MALYLPDDNACVTRLPTKMVMFEHIKALDVAQLPTDFAVPLAAASLVIEPGVVLAAMLLTTQMVRPDGDVTY